MSITSPSYTVQQRTLNGKAHSYAVLRRGPKGGTKLIAIYKSEWIAGVVAASLISHAEDEL